VREHADLGDREPKVLVGALAGAGEYHDLHERVARDDVQIRREHVVARVLPPALLLVHERLHLEADRHAHAELGGLLVVARPLVGLALALERVDLQRRDRPLPVAVGDIRDLEERTGIRVAHGLGALLGLLVRRVAPALLRDRHDRQAAKALLVLVVVPAAREERVSRCSQGNTK
jgi:hypothetical protein